MAPTTMQVVELPNGTFMLVFGGVENPDQYGDAFETLKDNVGAAAVFVSSEPVEVRR